MAATPATNTRNKPLGPPRLVYLDNLRVVLISLIVLLHLVITYGAPGGWYVHEVESASLGIGSLLAFILYNTTVQAFALGFFFLLSGYFTAASLEKKGTRKFLADRLIRLGIPLVVYTVVIDPVIVYLLYNRGGSIIGFLGHHFGEWQFTTGPMWFVATILIFTLIYIAWRQITGTSTTSAPQNAPRIGFLVALAFATGTVAFALRFVFPVGWSMPVLNFQLCYFSEYVVAFFLGTLAWRIRWFERAGDYRPEPWLGLVAVMILILPVMFLLGTKNSGIESFNGGMNWQSLSYALWEPFVFLGAVIGLSSLFIRYFNRGTGWFTTLPPNAYAVYVIHPAVLIALTSSARMLSLPPVMKSVVMTLPVLVSCFVAAGLLRKVPGVARVL